MTDYEIIKALEWNISKFGEEVCFGYMDKDGCKKVNAKDVLDIINRQNAEIDRLRKEVNLVSIQFQDLQERYEEAQTEIERLTKETMNMAITIESCQGEAIKEFAERLKDGAQMADCFDSYNMVVGTHFINDLLKEMIDE